MSILNGNIIYDRDNFLYDLDQGDAVDIMYQNFQKH